MAGRGPEERAEAIASVVERLERIRCDAGTPSFRAMAKRSGAISHATLHDAVQGTRLPSWETTVEFVRACDADPTQLRDAWIRAQLVVKGRSRSTMAAASSEARPSPVVDQPFGSFSPDTALQTPASGPPPTPSPTVPEAASEPIRRDAALRFGRFGRFGPAALVGAGLVAGVLITLSGSAVWQAAVIALRASAVAPVATASPEPCPSNTGSFPSLPPRHEGDKALLIADVSLPACSTQPRAAVLTKTWRLENQGSVEWQGRRLRRIDPDDTARACPTVPEVTVPDAQAGQSVDVSVDVTTPATDTVCFGRWVIVDRDGEYSFPGQRPLFFSFFVR